MTREFVREFKQSLALIPLGYKRLVRFLQVQKDTTNIGNSAEIKCCIAYCVSYFLYANEPFGVLVYLLRIRRLLYHRRHADAPLSYSESRILQPVLSYIECRATQRFATIRPTRSSTQAPR